MKRIRPGSGRTASFAHQRGSAVWTWLVIIAVAGALVAAAIWFYVRERGPATSYQTVPVTRGALTQSVTANGQLNPVVNVQVGSQISGIIEKLLVDFNSTVKSNQVIAQLDPATYQAIVHQAEGDVANAKAALELAQINASRSAELFASKLVSSSDNDKAQADLHQAQAQVQIKAAALEKSKVDLERCTITAPVDGVVISRNVDVGQTVAASLQAPTLFVIANDLARMQIDANVAEADVGGVETGQDVEFTVDAFMYRTFHGKVTQVRNAPITVQNVVTYDTVIAVDNSDLKLKPGMTANVSIILARRQDALRVPNAALRFRPAEAALAELKTNAAPTAAARPPAGGNGIEGQRGQGRGPGNRPGGPQGVRKSGERQVTSRSVYLLAGTGETAKPQKVSIKTGISDGTMTEVIEGLNENDPVVTGMIGSDNATANRPQNPFGGGFRRF